MNRRIVYYDFGRILTEEELISKIEARISELYAQGFSNQEIIKIIFECSEFKDSFFEIAAYENVKNRYKKSP